MEAIFLLILWSANAWAQDVPHCRESPELPAGRTLAELRKELKNVLPKNISFSCRPLPPAEESNFFLLDQVYRREIAASFLNDNFPGVKHEKKGVGDDKELSTGYGLHHNVWGQADGHPARLSFSLEQRMWMASPSYDGDQFRASAPGQMGREVPWWDAQTKDPSNREFRNHVEEYTFRVELIRAPEKDATFGYSDHLSASAHFRHSHDSFTGTRTVNAIHATDRNFEHNQIDTQRLWLECIYLPGFMLRSKNLTCYARTGPGINTTSLERSTYWRVEGGARVHTNAKDFFESERPTLGVGGKYGRDDYYLANDRQAFLGLEALVGIPTGGGTQGTLKFECKRFLEETGRPIRNGDEWVFQLTASYVF